MTHQNDYTLTRELAERGLDAVPELLRVLIYNAMQAERSKYLQADEYELSEDRKGHANGYKPKTVKTRMGENHFCRTASPRRWLLPKCAGKGFTKRRALVTTLAAMYVQGGSTSKVKAISEQLCGVEISAMQVSHAAAQLDEVLQVWRERPLGEITYLYVDARYEKGASGRPGAGWGSIDSHWHHSKGERQVPRVLYLTERTRKPLEELPEGPEERGMKGVKLVISDDHEGLELPGKRPW